MRARSNPDRRICGPRNQGRRILSQRAISELSLASRDLRCDGRSPWSPPPPGPLRKPFCGGGGGGVWRRCWAAGHGRLHLRQASRHRPIIAKLHKGGKFVAAYLPVESKYTTISFIYQKYSLKKLRMIFSGDVSSVKFFAVFFHLYLLVATASFG